jgi:hypothetical protein
MVVWSHLSASWSDPGLVGKDTTGMYLQAFEKQLEKAINLEANGHDVTIVRRLRKSFCKKCLTPKPEGAHHCSTCNRCVRKMDHHCPWINNCVGERNLKAFFLFLCYVTIGTGYAIIMYIIRAHQIITAPLPEDRRPSYTRNIQIFIVVSCILACILAIFFFAFVMCMCYDQYEAMTTGVPGVDAMQMKDDIPRVQSCWKGFKKMAMANEKFGFRWFLPFAPKLPQPPPPPPPASAPPEKDQLLQNEVQLQSPFVDPLKEGMTKLSAEVDAQLHHRIKQENEIRSKQDIMSNEAIPTEKQE